MADTVLPRQGTSVAVVLKKTSRTLNASKAQDTSVAVLLKKSTKTFSCDNCTHLVLIDDLCVTGFMEQNKVKNTWKTVTVGDVISKVFKIDSSSGKFLIKTINLELCSTCGKRLGELYKCYELFIELAALNSKISKLRKSSGKAIVQLESLNIRDKMAPQPSGSRISSPASPEVTILDPEDYAVDHPVVTLEDSPSPSPISNIVSESEDIEDEETDPLRIDDYISGPLPSDIPDHFSNPGETDFGDSERTTFPEHRVKVVTKAKRFKTKSTPSVPKADASDSGEEERDAVRDKLLVSTALQLMKKNMTQHVEAEFRVEPETEASKAEFAEYVKIIESKAKQRAIDRSEIIQAIKVKNRLKCLAYKKSKRVPTPCPRCSKVLTSSYHLRVHVRTVHQNLRAYKCTSCEKCFKPPGSQKLHRKVHKGPAGISALCGSCRKTFRTVV